MNSKSELPCEVNSKYANGVSNLTVVSDGVKIVSNSEDKESSNRVGLNHITHDLLTKHVTLKPVIADNKACQFFLLGPFMISDLEGNAVTPKSQKTCAMLAMLARSPRATRTRVWLRDKLWSDRGDEQAAASLRQALLDARRSLRDLGSDIIVADKKSISLNLESIHLDTEQLIQSVSELANQEDSIEQVLNEDLLEGMDIRDPEFEDWLTLERQVWEQQVVQKLEDHQGDDLSIAPIKTDESSTTQSAIGQKVRTTVVCVRLDTSSSSTSYESAVARVRDVSLDSGGRVYAVKREYILMEFERPVDALGFAANLHQRISAQSTGEAPLQLAVGVNSGLVFRQNNQVFGTDSDIAVQASDVASFGSVMMTEASCALVQGKTEINFVADTVFESENLSKPVQLFRVDHVESKAVQGAPKLANGPTFESRKTESHSEKKGPSIGVLPFRNADDSTNDYIGEGLADDIIVALSRNHWLNVISRNSSFSYEPSSMSSSAIANDLNVMYVVSGVVKKLESKITIVVTLESTATKRIIWSEPFTVELTDIMQLQNLVSTEITAHLMQELGKHEQLKAYESRIDDLTTWQLVHRGHWHMARRNSTGVARAKNLYESALERDPFQTDALLALAWWYFWKAWLEHGIKENAEDLKQCQSLCRKAMLMDASDGRVYAYLGAIEIMRNDAGKSLGLFDEAIRLNPSLSLAYASRGSANLLLGKAELAPADIRNALALNPADYYRFHSLAELASSYFFSSEIDKSLEAAENSSFLAPRYWYARLIKIACLVQRDGPGDKELAAQEKAEIVSRKVNVSEENIRAIPFVNRDYTNVLINAYKEV